MILVEHRQEHHSGTNVDHSEQLFSFKSFKISDMKSIPIWISYQPKACKQSSKPDQKGIWLSPVPCQSVFISGFVWRLPVHQLDIFETGIKYNKLWNMVMIIYWANKNDPDGSTSSQIHANTCNTEDEAKEETFFGKKITGAMPFVGPGFSGKNN